MPIVIETFEEFAARHGEHFASRGRWLFADGAVNDGSYNYEPPEDERARRAIQREFLQAKLAARIHRYNADRESISEQARYHAMGAGPMPEPGAIEYLQRLAEEIEVLQEQLAELSRAVPENRQARERDLLRASEQAAANRVLGALRQLPTF